MDSDVTLRESLHWLEDDLVALVREVEKTRDATISLRDGASGETKTSLRRASAALDTAYACVREAQRDVLATYGTL